MIYIATGFAEFDIRLSSEIENSKVIFYRDFLRQTDDYSVVVISTFFDRHTNKEEDRSEFINLLFSLRARDKRVILLVDEDEREVLTSALALGIYDIVMYPAEVSDVVYRIKNPATFSSVKSLFEMLKVVEHVGFEDVLKVKDTFKERFKTRAEQECAKQSNMEDIKEKEVSEEVKTTGKDTFIQTGYEEDIKRILAGVLRFLGVKKIPSDIYEMLVLLEDSIADTYKK
ncbi:hypothetical protein B0S90_2801 [Caldicellulosiruptor bescii]|uniref:Uncharacterized protein n=2 Tax=Caldicellulosiruptor bescii TaxID=31899 RepID=B9MNJ6_CALBD|nr:hypothetical protein [Caldicellulosiruptor bescii]ACM61527.1 conserved hypothetical protein [Caldicellulosiruptor bescii DSM 6725]PBC88661.1 hypothetical protein B0S87_1690 [Caldicellulosiruptor bescii]PBC91858.1 hypothetical protein B0S89_2303 [Caldicellulosiruptor bescii]PBD02731.1 hypothetical protein B0S85_0271 [Caldicellulosiruptor bescii]PBD07652.1 hypothetical protein B0S90_2801 [Caldicellulosiruptor bescii]